MSENGTYGQNLDSTPGVGIEELPYPNTGDNGRSNKRKLDEITDLDSILNQDRTTIVYPKIKSAQKTRKLFPGLVQIVQRSGENGMEVDDIPNKEIYIEETNRRRKWLLENPTYVFLKNIAERTGKSVYEFMNTQVSELEKREKEYEDEKRMQLKKQMEAEIDDKNNTIAELQAVLNKELTKNDRHAPPLAYGDKPHWPQSDALDREDADSLHRHINDKQSVEQGPIKLLTLKSYVRRDMNDLYEKCLLRELAKNLINDITSTSNVVHFYKIYSTALNPEYQFDIKKDSTAVALLNRILGSVKTASRLNGVFKVWCFGDISTSSDNMFLSNTVNSFGCSINAVYGSLSVILRTLDGMSAGKNSVKAMIAQYAAPIKAAVEKCKRISKEVWTSNDDDNEDDEEEEGEEGEEGEGEDKRSDQKKKGETRDFTDANGSQYSQKEEKHIQGKNEVKNQSAESLSMKMNLDTLKTTLEELDKELISKKSTSVKFQDKILHSMSVLTGIVGKNRGDKRQDKQLSAVFQQVYSKIPAEILKIIEDPEDAVSEAPSSNRKESGKQSDNDRYSYYSNKFPNKESNYPELIVSLFIEVFPSIKNILDNVQYNDDDGEEGQKNGKKPPSRKGGEGSGNNAARESPHPSLAPNSPPLDAAKVDEIKKQIQDTKNEIQHLIANTLFRTMNPYDFTPGSDFASRPEITGEFIMNTYILGFIQQAYQEVKTACKCLQVEPREASFWETNTDFTNSYADLVCCLIESVDNNFGTRSPIISAKQKRDSKALISNSAMRIATRYKRDINNYKRKGG